MPPGRAPGNHLGAAGLRNDVGLLAKEYDQARKRQAGNFPQAFSHLALLVTAHDLLDTSGSAHQRSTKTSATNRADQPMEHQDE